MHMDPLALDFGHLFNFIVISEWLAGLHHFITVTVDQDVEWKSINRFLWLLAVDEGFSRCLPRLPGVGLFTIQMQLT